MAKDRPLWVRLGFKLRLPGFFGYGGQFVVNQFSGGLPYIGTSVRPSC